MWPPTTRERPHIARAVSVITCLMAPHSSSYVWPARVHGSVQIASHWVIFGRGRGRGRGYRVFGRTALWGSRRDMLDVLHVYIIFERSIRYTAAAAVSSE